MSLNPIGYVVQLPIPDGVTLYLARFTRGGVELTADLDRAMNYIDESDPRDPKYGSFVLQRTAQTNHQIGAWQRDLEERDNLPDPLPGTTIEETQ